MIFCRILKNNKDYKYFNRKRNIVDQNTSNVTDMSDIRKWNTSNGSTE